jgi:hypothetical protein
MTMLDMRKLIMASIKMSIVAFILNPLRWFKKEPEHPGEF